MKINICIPVFNEEENLPSFLTSLNKFTKEFHSEEIKLEVIFYNDGSTDGSTELLKIANIQLLVSLIIKDLGTL